MVRHGDDSPAAAHTGFAHSAHRGRARGILHGQRQSVLLIAFSRVAVALSPVALGEVDEAQSQGHCTRNT
ncbi:hypothetical protein PUN4_60136 [Paraburkholderia unamae]|nr:hypothetical protein PUN4_60136 [Paraburkholderia unamae]